MKFKKGDVVGRMCCDVCTLLTTCEHVGALIESCHKDQRDLGNLIPVVRGDELLYRAPRRRKSSGGVERRKR